MDNYIEFFNNYTKKYDMKNINFKRKYEHSFRVMNYSIKIGNSLNLSPKNIKICKIIGLFHDIGRFPEYFEYRTFNDKKAFDHGDKSYEILKENNIKNHYILKAVKYHNKLKIPVLQTNKEKMYCNIIRDADKIDILLTQNNKFKKSNYILDDKIYEAFKKHKLIKNDLVKNDIDSGLRNLAFIFDLNYSKSFKIIRESNIINKKIDAMIKSSKNYDLNKIRDILNKYMEERL